MKFEDLEACDARQFIELNKAPGLINRLEKGTVNLLKSFADDPFNKIVSSLLQDRFQELQIFNNMIRERKKFYPDFKYYPVHAIKVTKDDLDTHFTIPSILKNYTDTIWIPLYIRNEVNRNSRYITQSDPKKFYTFMENTWWLDEKTINTIHQTYLEDESKIATWEMYIYDENTIKIKIVQTPNTYICERKFLETEKMIKFAKSFFVKWLSLQDAIIM